MPATDSRFRPLRVGALCSLLCLLLGAPGLADGTRGQRGDRPRPPHSFELDLGGLRFDPLTEFPELPSRGLHAGLAGADFRLIQFQGPIRGEWLAATRALGIEIVQYVHPFTYVVWADRAQLQAARGLGEVRWAGEHAVEFRVLPHQRGRGPEVVPTMALVSRHVDEASVRLDLEIAGAVVRDLSPVTSQLSVAFLDVPGDKYQALGAIPAVYTVQYIRPETAPRGEMSNQSIVGNYGPPPTHELFPGYASWLATTGYDGSDVIVGIVDGGIRTSHVDLADRIAPCVPSGDTPTSCTTSNNNHGTHVAGAVAGTGATGTTDAAGFLRGQGVAPGASVVQQRYGAFIGGGPGGMIPDGMLKIYRESALSGALLTNNSWGPTGSPQGYDIPTQQIDIITRDADPNIAGHQPVLPVWSIMNGNGDSFGACAPSSLGSPDEAKNLFAVGSTRMQSGVGQQYPNLFDVSPNSAHGPACDGRLVPHVVAPGCSTDSTTSSSDSSHGLLCGTSMASPVASGAVSVFIERYRNLYGSDPSPALVKAAFTAVAANLSGFLNADGGVMGHPPDRFQGWGRLDLHAVANPPDGVQFFDQEEVFTATGESWSIPLIAEDPAKPVRLMLVWTDAPGHGLGGTTPAWVNDLDLVVEVGGDTYLGNQIGGDGFSQTGGTADEMNNTEGVFLAADQHGGNAFDVTISAANLAGDALDPYDLDSPDLTQDFALACYNCAPGVSTFTVEVDPSSAAVCAPVGGTEDLLVDVAVGAVGGYAGTVSLSAAGEPVGVTSSFEPQSVAPPGGSVWTLTVDETIAGGPHAITASGDDGLESHTDHFTLVVEEPLADAPPLVRPGDGAGDVDVQPEFAWRALTGITEYRLEVATDDGFGGVVIDEVVTGTSFTPDTPLAGATTYFWRVRGLNLCGDGAAGNVFTFTTLHIFAPAALEVDSGGNLVFEPGETIEVAPAWRNDGALSELLTGVALDFSGPPGANYTLVSDQADYGSVDPGATASCQATGVCYEVEVDDPAARPDLHWDATLAEELSDGTARDWVVHIGESFGDVPPANIFYRFIETLLHHGVTVGCGNGDYCPGDPVSREQMAVFVLVALEGTGYSPPACVAGSEAFADVPASSPFCPWIEELFDRGVVAGCGGGDYCPGDPVTREQMAVFTLATLEGPAYTPPTCVTGSEVFGDVPASSPFCPWVEELFDRGVVAGCGGGDYCPDDPVTRGQMGAFVSGTFGLVVYGPALESVGD